MNQLPLDLLNYIGKYSYLIFIFILLQGSLLLILFYVFAEKLINTKSKKIQDKIIKEAAYQQAVTTLEEAKQASIQLIQEANKKARDLISGVELVNSNTTKSIDEKIEELSARHIKTLDDTTSEFISTYKEALSAEGVKTTEELEKTTSIVKESLLQEVDQFKEVIRKETYEAEQAVQDKIKSEYSVMRDEIDAYKKNKIESINTKIYEIIVEATKNTATVVLDLDTQQKMIKDFLDQAIKDKKF